MIPSWVKHISIKILNLYEPLLFKIKQHGQKQLNKKVFNKNCGKFSMKCGPTSTYNNPHKSPPKICSFSANFYLPILLSFLFAKLSLQFPPTLPPCKTHQFLSSLFLDAGITTISFKSSFLSSTV